MSKKLDEIRRKIDAIDDSVHDLLMQRAALVSSVAEAKREEGMQIVQPAREARMIRRLLARHHGPLPAETVVRIWRELVGSVSLLQTGLSVIVAADEKSCPYWDMAKDYFGSVVPMKIIQGTSAAISAVHGDDASFAVLPWPEVDEVSPWWMHLFVEPAEENLRVICALPYGRDNAQNRGSRALVVSKIKYLPSGNDVSFIGLETDSSLSRTRIMNSFSDAGLKPLNLFGAASPYHADTSLSFLEVKDYIEEGAEVLDALREKLGDQCRYCAVLGGYPAVPEM